MGGQNNGIIHQLVPGETTGSVTRFLDYWHPDVGIFQGIPDRPNLIHIAKNKRIPLFLTASSRNMLSAQRKLSALSSGLLREFEACLAASAADAQVLNRNREGTVRAEITGPLSDAIITPACSDAERDETAAHLQGRPVWLAADINRNEIDLVEAAHRRAFRFAHRLLLVIIPTSPDAGPAIARDLKEKGWEVGLGSTGEPVSDAVQVYVADGEEVHGLWYRLAPITFVGGTLTGDVPASDPFAPASLGSAVLHGPETAPQTKRFRKLRDADACLQVDSAESLGAAVQRLLAPDKAAILAQAGWNVTTESALAVERLVELINETLDTREAS